MRPSPLCLLALSALTSCGATSSTPAPPLQPPPLLPAADADPLLSAPDGLLSEPLASLSWMPGAWQRTDGRGTEHWVATGTILWGIAFTTNTNTTATTSFEVLFINAAEDTTLELTAIPGGERGVTFRRTAATDRSATFSNPAHDDPIAITYSSPVSGKLVAQLESPSGTTPPPPFEHTATTAARADALDAADRDFAADTAKRGTAGWVPVFAPDGGMWRGDHLLRGAEAIRVEMAPLLDNPDARLEWAPIASALSPAGDVGYTVGRYRSLRRGDDGLLAVRSRGTYCTIWRRQPDGSWKIVWDGGQPG